jgi:transposase
VSEEADLAQLNVEPDRRFIPVCHVCGSKAERIHEWHVRMVRDLNMANARVFIRARYRNIRCGVCERIRVEDLGFFEPHKRVTRRLAKYIHDLCKMLPVKQVADHLGLDWKTVKNVDKYFLEEEYGKTNYDDLKIIAVDEIALRKGHNYMTVILDYDSGRVVWVGKGRDSNTLKAFFEGMTEEQKAQVEAVAIDMWDPYIKAIQETLPGKVKIVFDLFHVVAAFSRLIDRVRISEYGKASEEDKKVIKGSKYLLLKNKKNIRKKEAREHLKKLLELNETISTMMILKDLLKRIWTYKYRGWVTKRLDEWCEMAQTIPYVYVHKFAKQLQRYSYGILNHCEYPLNTSRLEGCNNKIKVIKRQAYGFHDERYFGLKIIQAFDPT